MRTSWIAAILAGALALAPVAARAGALFDATPGDAQLGGFPFWQAVLADMQAAGPDCTDQRHCTPKDWTGLLDTLRGRDARAQMEAVNAWVNDHPHVEDFANWGVPDYWETPGELLARGGDCEDFAIAKYFSLLRLGFAAQNLRIVIVSDSTSHSFHAVLAVQQDKEAWLLDDQLAQVIRLDDQPRYTPVYSLNGEGWWLHSRPVLAAVGGVVMAAAGD